MAIYHIMCFLKFGRPEHIKELLEKGTIYMNSIQYFRTYEDNFTRGDIYEGVSRLKNYPPGEFEIKELNYRGKYESLHLRESFQEVLGNIYSLYCVSSFHIENPFEFHIDLRNLNFGSQCLFIKNNPEFLLRVENKLKMLGLRYRHGFVDYYNKFDKVGDITLFEKPMEYSYQNEFRFYVERKSTMPFNIEIGNLSDIAEVYSAEQMVNSLELKYNKRKIA